MMRVVDQPEVLSRRGSGRLRVAAVALGCPKNTYDLEHMLGLGFTGGVCIVNHLEEAEVIIVNSCSFLKEAVAESDREIARALLHKRQDGVPRVVVTGCYPVFLRQRGLRLPHGVDALLGPQELHTLPHLLREWFPQRCTGFRNGEAARVLTTPCSVAYLKIADGCDMKCAFCLIPSFRGPYRSRPPGEILEEAQSLLACGVKELNLVSQDSTDYGRDLGTNLMELLEALADLPGDFWVRVQYLYPAKVQPDLLQLMAAYPEKLIPYFDLPIQHVSNAVLARMRRAESAQLIRSLFGLIRAALPGASINANAIVGFPGETEEDFAELAAFVEEGNVDRLGVFTYSDLPGMESHDFPLQVPEDTKLLRREKLMLLQQRVSLDKHRRLIGQVTRVLVDAVRRERGRNTYIGRTYRDAYEVNGLALVRSDRPLIPGEFYRARVTAASPYDLMCKHIPD